MVQLLTSAETSATAIGQIIQLSVAPVFLLAGVGAFLNVCAGRLSRIVDRARNVEPKLLAARGSEHDRHLAEVRTLDRRMGLVSWAIFFSVLAAILICLVVILLFASALTEAHFGRPIALLFIGAMTSIGLGFGVFLLETRVGSRSVRIRAEILEHMAEEREAD